MSIRSWNLCIFIFLWGTNNGVCARVKMQTCYAQLMTVVAVLWVMFIVVDVCLPIKRPLYVFVFSFPQSARNKMLNIQRSMVVRITIWHVKDFAHNQHNTISLGQNTKTIKYYCVILLSMTVDSMFHVHQLCFNTKMSSVWLCLISLLFGFFSVIRQKKKVQFVSLMHIWNHFTFVMNNLWFFYYLVIYYSFSKCIQ